jgi:hypothetical protein
MAGSLVKRPDAANGEKTMVYVSVFLLDIDNVSSADQSFTANISYELRWKDSRLAHSEDGSIVRSIDEVWNPRIQVVNQQRLLKTFPEVVRISPVGEVSYLQRIWGNLSQPMDLREFPFDSQQFRFDLVSAGYSPEEVVLVPDPEQPSGIADKLSLPDWDITGFASHELVYQPHPAVEPLAAFRTEVTADRKIGFFIVKVILPLILIVAMSWIAFWIDPTQAGSQIGVATTSMLTLIAYRFAVGGYLPSISYLTRLDGFILISTAIVFATLVEVVVTSTLARDGRLDTARRVDNVARAAFPVVFGAVTVYAFLF